MSHTHEFLAYREKAADSILVCPAYPASRFDGDGIVVCAGGPTYFVQAWVQIRLLRKLGCELPIELWYRGPGELTAPMRELLEPYGVTCQDAFEVCRRLRLGELHGWALKPFAIIHSSFRRVLYLDADNVPVRDPSYLFEDPALRTHGCLFWTDRHRGLLAEGGTVHPAAWSAFNVTHREAPECESGQVLVDKSRVWRELDLALHYNQQAEFYYRFVYGDKDTFRFAWYRLGTDFNTIPFGPSSPPNYRVLYQHDSTGSIVFQHRARAKWRLFGSNPVVPGFQHGPSCISFLHELRLHWPEIVQAWQEAGTKGERIHRRQLIEQRHYQFHHQSKYLGAVSFLANGVLEHSSQLLPQHWQVVEHPGGQVTLDLSGDAAPLTLRLLESHWHGVRVNGQRRRIEFAPVETAVDSPATTTSIPIASPIATAKAAVKLSATRAADEFRSIDAYSMPSDAYAVPKKLSISEDSYSDARSAQVYSEGREYQLLSSEDVYAGARFDVDVYGNAHPMLQRQASWADRYPKSAYEVDAACEDAYSQTSPLTAESVTVSPTCNPQLTPIKIFGLPRTCTNLLTVLLRRNFRANVFANRLGWKHGPNLFRQGDRVARHPIRFVLCTRHPYAWLVSAYRFEIIREEQFRSFPEFVLGTSVTYPGQNPIDCYNFLNRLWQSIGASPRLFQRIQAESLQANPRQVLCQLEEQFELTRQHPDWLLERNRVGPDERIRPAPYDPSWHQHQRYLEYFDSSLLREVNRRLHSDLVGKLGYQLTYV